MKTLKDLKFSIIPTGGICGTCEIDNGNEISVAMGENTYGGKSGFFEIVVFKSHDSNESVKLKCLSGGDVEGYLNIKEVEEKMIKIQKELGCDILDCNLDDIYE